MWREPLAQQRHDRSKPPHATANSAARWGGFFASGCRTRQDTETHQDTQTGTPHDTKKRVATVFVNLSRGEYHPLKVATRVRIPLGLPTKPQLGGHFGGRFFYFRAVVGTRQDTQHTIWRYTPPVHSPDMDGNLNEIRPGVWRIRVSAGVDRVTGKRRVISKTVKGDRAAAELARARLVLERTDRGIVPTNATISDLFAAYLPVAKLSAAAAYDYALVARKHIEPRIGHVPLSKVTPFFLDQFYADLAEADVSPTRIRKVHTVLRSAFRRAVKWGWIPANPATDPDLPPLDDTEIEPPTPEQVRALFAAAEARDLRIHVAIHLAATLGCRRGELCGLQWPDVDFDRATITIRRSVGVIAGQPIIKRPKESTRRKRNRKPTPIGPETVALLKRWRLATAEQRLATVDRGGDWLFPSVAPGGFARPDVMSRMFRELATAAGLPETARLHDLRHYVATQLLVNGHQAGTVAGRVGHTRESTTTDLYGHQVDPAARAAGEAIERINRGD